MGFVDDNGAEQLHVGREHNILEPERPSAQIPDEELAKRLIIDNCYLKESHAHKIWPCGDVRIVEDERFDGSELFELTLPVDLQRCRTDDQAGVGSGAVGDSDRLERFAESRFVADDEPFAPESEEYALALVGVWLNPERVCQFRHFHPLS